MMTTLAPALTELGPRELMSREVCSYAGVSLEGADADDVSAFG
jgi:hypothetical protein